MGVKKIQDIEIATLAKHFESLHSSPRSAYESFRQLKRKEEAGNGGLWNVYVKAYRWDTRQGAGR